MSSSNEVTWYKGNELLLDIVAPLDGQDPSAPVVMDSAVGAGYLFDKRIRVNITGTAAGAQMTLPVDDTSELAVGDRMVVMLEDGSLQQLTVDTLTATQITFTANLTDSVHAGSLLRKVVGVSAAVVGAAYGTPAVGTSNWGYTFGFDHQYSPFSGRDMLIEAYVRLEKVATGAVYSRSWDVAVADARGAP